MRFITYVLMASSAILLPGLAFGQYGYVQECKETVANQLNVSPLDVNAILGAFSPSGSRIVNWQAQRSSDRIGYCEFNTATGELLRAESGSYAGPVAYHPGFNNAPVQQTMQAADYNQSAVNAPLVKVNNSGHGDFKGPHKSFHIRHSWLDTRGPQTIVTLSDGDDYKISFYGSIIQQNGDREFTMDISNCNLGGATGTATFRLSPDDKRVEYISMNGTLRGRDFNGNFKR